MQTECFLYSSPKAGLNAELPVGVGKGQNAKHWQLIRPCEAKRGRRQCLNCPDFAELDSLHFIESRANCEFCLSRSVPACSQSVTND